MKTLISKCKITWFTGEKCIFWKSSLRQCFAEGGGYLKSFTNHWNVYSSYDNKGWFAGNTCRVFCSWEMTECDFWCFDVNNELKWVTLINVSLVSLVVLPGLKEKFLKFMNIWKDIFLFIIFINIYISNFSMWVLHVFVLILFETQQLMSHISISSHSWTRDNIRSILSRLRRNRTGLLLSGQSPLRWK